MRLVATRSAAQLALASMLVAASLHAQSPNNQEQALAHSRQASELHRRGERAKALEHYRLAAQLAPTAIRVLNLASAYQDVSNMPAAVTEFRRLKQDYWKQLNEDQQRYVVEQLRKLAPFVSEVKLSVEAPEATIAIDGVPWGKGPLRQALLLSPGEHKIAVTTPSRPKDERVVQLAPNGSSSLVFENPSAAFGNTVGVTTPSKPPLLDERSLRIVVWGGAAGTILTGAVAGVFWGLASSSKSKFDARVDSYLAGDIELDDPELQQTRNDARSYGNWAIGMGITAGVIALGTTVTYLIGQRHQERSVPAGGATRTGGAEQPKSVSLPRRFVVVEF